MVKKSELYAEMISLERKALKAQDILVLAIEKWWKGSLPKEESDKLKVILGAGGYIQIRTVQTVEDEFVSNFEETFNFEQTWFREENMTDYRSSADVSIIIYEYGFVPKDIKKIWSDNQVVPKEC